MIEIMILFNKFNIMYSRTNGNKIITYAVLCGFRDFPRAYRNRVSIGVSCIGKTYDRYGGVSQGVCSRSLESFVLTVLL